jgi:hypothetical protein
LVVASWEGVGAVFARDGTVAATVFVDSADAFLAGAGTVAATVPACAGGAFFVDGGTAAAAVSEGVADELFADAETAAVAVVGSNALPFKPFIMSIQLGGERRPLKLEIVFPTPDSPTCCAKVAKGLS